MPKRTALEKIEEIQTLRSRGITFEKIAKQVEVGINAAFNHGHNYSPENKRITLGICNHQLDGLICKRSIGHPGIHLSNDSRKRLISWEK